jgi:hypothetical protein
VSSTNEYGDIVGVDEALLQIAATVLKDVESGELDWALTTAVSARKA